MGLLIVSFRNKKKIDVYCCFRCVGKSCLLMKYTSDTFLHESPPTVFENYASYANVDGCSVNLCEFKECEVKSLSDNNKNVSAFYDTSGDPNFSSVRPISYPDTDVFLVCFSVVDFFSFDSIENYWVPEIRHHCPQTPIVLVGTKLDLRSDEKTLQRLGKQSSRVIKHAEVSFAKFIKIL